MKNWKSKIGWLVSIYLIFTANLLCSQTEYCTKDSSLVYTYVDKDAIFIGEKNESIQQFIISFIASKEFGDKDLSLLKGIELKLIITINGKVSVISINQIDNYQALTPLEKAIWDKIEGHTEWIPASCGNMFVNSYKIIKMNIGAY